MDKHSIIYLAFPLDIVMTRAIDRYIERFGVKPVKAIVPVRDNPDSPFNYDIENLAEGAEIEIEPSSSVSTVLLTSHNIIYANNSRVRKDE